MKLPKNRQYTVRLMAPFNMRCKTCGEYIYKGKKFNARKEDVENQDYLGIRIYRFYIKVNYHFNILNVFHVLILIVSVQDVCKKSPLKRIQETQTMKLKQEQQGTSWLSN